MNILNTSQRGHLGELKVAAAAAEKGYYVGFMPQQCPYDMVIDRGKGPERVQVKSRKLATNGTLNVGLTVEHHANNNVEYSANNVDILAIYEPTTDRIAWVNIHKVENMKGLTLRIVPAKNNQTKNVTLFEDYEEW